MKLKKFLCFTISAVLCLSILASCGKNADTDSGNSVNNNNVGEIADPDATPYIAQEIPSKFKASGKNITESADGGVEVGIDAREGSERYNFENEDLGFVDTLSGAQLNIGMSADEIESLIGKPRVIDLDYRVYNGIVIQYNNDMNAIKLIVAEGNMEQDDNPVRFVSPRGIKLSSSFDDFISVYGDEYYAAEMSSEENDVSMNGSTRAIRYYAKDGNSYTYLGQSYNKDNKPESDSDLIMQTFLFEPGTNVITAITVQTGESK